MSASLNAAVIEPLKGATPPDQQSRQMLTRALDQALASIDRNLAHFGDDFPAPSSTAGVYPAIGNIEWTNGFWTGMLWLALSLIHI